MLRLVAVMLALVMAPLLQPSPATAATLPLLALDGSYDAFEYDYDVPAAVAQIAVNSIPSTWRASSPHGAALAPRMAWHAYDYLATFVAPQSTPRGPDFVVDSRGTAVPTDPGRLRNGLETPGAFQDVSTNPATSRKFVGVDDGDPLRLRIEKGHFDDPSYTGPRDPLHTVDHLHVERRAYGATGPWTEQWKIRYDWPF